MGDVNYTPVIQDMTWSYSRIGTFEQCAYRWFLRYIRHIKGKEMFFSSYGSFVHKILEMYYKNEISKNEMPEIYLRDFKKEVVGRSPGQKVFGNYFKSGLKYLREFEPVPYKILGVEKEIKFTVDNIPFMGIIDLLCEDEEGNLIIVDNKSRMLKQRTGRAKPTVTDEELDKYLRQLYIYAEGVRQEMGKLPKYLCFNCFRSQMFIKELFDEQAFESSKRWLRENVNTITYEEDFKPDIDWFKCENLCEVNDSCEYYSMTKKKGNH